MSDHNNNNPNQEGQQEDSPHSSNESRDLLEDLANAAAEIAELETPAERRFRRQIEREYLQNPQLQSNQDLLVLNDSDIIQEEQLYEAEQGTSDAGHSATTSTSASTMFQPHQLDDVQFMPTGFLRPSTMNEPSTSTTLQPQLFNGSNDASTVFDESLLSFSAAIHSITVVPHIDRTRFSPFFRIVGGQILPPRPPNPSPDVVEQEIAALSRVSDSNSILDLPPRPRRPSLKEKVEEADVVPSPTPTPGIIDLTQSYDHPIPVEMEVAAEVEVETSSPSNSNARPSTSETPRPQYPILVDNDQFLLVESHESEATQSSPFFLLPSSSSSSQKRTALRIESDDEMVLKRAREAGEPASDNIHS